MRSPALAKAVLAVVLVVTVAWKLAARVNDDSYLVPSVIAFLDGQGYVAGRGQDAVEGIPVVHATHADCRLQVMKVSYYGADRDFVRSLTPAGDRLMFVYRGRVYPQQPVWFIVTDQVWMRLLRSLDLSDHDPPVLAVIAASGCQAGRLPWAELK